MLQIRHIENKVAFVREFLNHLKVLGLRDGEIIDVIAEDEEISGIVEEIHEIAFPKAYRPSA